MATLHDKNYANVHYWIKAMYGRAYKCENNTCLGNSKKYEWAKLKGKNYEKKRDCFMQLCKVCHSKYDFTEETRQKLIKINTGRIQTEESKKKRSKSLTGRNPTPMQSNIIKILQGKPVNQILGRKVIKQFRTMADAERALGLASGCISAALRRRCKSGGYNWELVKIPNKKAYVDKLKKEVVHLRPNLPPPVGIIKN